MPSQRADPLMFKLASGLVMEIKKIDPIGTVEPLTITLLDRNQQVILDKRISVMAPVPPDDNAWAVIRAMHGAHRMAGCPEFYSFRGETASGLVIEFKKIAE
jgi:hypothetical protein